MSNKLFAPRITLLLTALFLFSSGAFCQNKKPGEISAEGTASIKVKPDIVVFTLTVDKRDSIEKNVITLLNQEVEAVSGALEKLGFKDSNIKVSDYRINSILNDVSGQKIYTASNILKVQFGLDNKMINALYAMIQKNDFRDLDLSYETTLSDSLERSTRARLVQLAIEDAKTNAANISKGLGLTIVKVKQVFKDNMRSPVFLTNFSRIDYAAPQLLQDTYHYSSTSFDKFQVEETLLEEKITVVYEVSN